MAPKKKEEKKEGKKSTTVNSPSFGSLLFFGDATVRNFYYLFYKYDAPQRLAQRSPVGLHSPIASRSHFAFGFGKCFLLLGDGRLKSSPLDRFYYPAFPFSLLGYSGHCTLVVVFAGSR